MAAPPPPVDPAGSSELAGAALAQTRAFVVAFDDRLRYANPAAVRVWGHDREELVGASIAPLLHPDSRPRAAELAAVCAAGGRLPDEIELRIRRRDGRPRRLRLAVSAIELGDRRLVLTTGLEADHEHRTRERLRRSQESLALVQQAARSVYWEWEPDSDRLTITRFADELFGFSVHNVARTGTEFVDLVHPEDRDRLRRALIDSLKGEDDLALELRFITPSGEVRWLSERGVAVRDDDGRTRRIIGVAQDISERKVAEEALFLEKDKADVTLASIAEGVLRTDERGMIDYLNPVAQRLTGWSLAEAYGRPAEEVYRVVDGETGERLLDPLTQCLSDRRQSIFAGDRTLADRNGGLHPVQDSAAPIRSRTGEIIGAVLVFRDLSRLREIEREMDRLSSHDPLTGLINRRAFAAEIERALNEARSEARRHALCHFDLDNFRLINETGGESAGDRLIQQTARLISAHLGDADLLAHLGGDAFGVLFRDSTPERAHEIADEIRRAIRATRFSTGDRSFSTAVSVGVVAIGPEPIDPTALLRDAEADGAAAMLRDADAACLVAKERGGDRIHSYQAGDSAIAERYGQMQWIARITDAFDDDRFVLFHQTIVPLYDGGADEPPLHELLVRLIDDSGELVGPGSFIPAAERFGMISRIDRWVLHNALRVLASSGGAPGEAEPRFTINVSGFSLGAADFLDMVIAELEATGVDPSRVLFEITETAAIADLERARRFLTALKARGCKFILDDFGKGLSSLGYLRNLPLDYLKIDGSFVRNITVDPIQTALVASIHEIGDVMGLRTIAESVEDEDTLEAVRRIGIDYAQGFLLARPEPLGGAGEGRGSRGAAMPPRLEPRAPHRYRTN